MPSSRAGRPGMGGCWRLIRRDRRAYPAQMLPAGFEWRDVLRPDSGIHALCLNGHEVARLSQKVGGEWYALLHPYAAPFSPYVARDCASFESGKAGCEAWACRHEARLRAEVAGR